MLAAGVRCAVVDRELERINAAACNFLLGFARANELSLRPGRKRQRPEDVAPGLASALIALEGLSLAC